MDLLHQGTAPDQTGNRPEVQRQRRYHQDAEQQRIDPMRCSLHASNRTIRAGCVGELRQRVSRRSSGQRRVGRTGRPVDPSVEGITVLLPEPGITWSTTRMADNHLSDL